MLRRTLGAHGPDISVVGFGAWEMGGDAWGPNPPVDELFAAVRAGLDDGIDWIDTAEVYGRGRSEELVAEAVTGRRDDLTLATKVAPKPEGSGFRPAEVRAACDASLRRLRTDRIDLFQLHWPDESGIPVEETWTALADLVQAGKVRFLGLSNFSREEIERCLAIRHVDSVQPHLSMLHPGHRDLARWCGENDVGVVTYGSLAYGLLTGAIDAETTFDRKDWRSGSSGGSYWRRMFAPGKLERSLAVVEALRPVAERLGATVSQVALAWLIHQPGVTSAIAGSRSARHVKENAGAGDLRLDETTLAELEEIVRLGPDFQDDPSGR